MANITIIANREKGYVTINGTPWQIGTIEVDYNGNIVSLFDRFRGRVPISSATYDKYENDSGTFASLDDLKAYISDNFFFDVTGGSGSQRGNTYIKRYIATEADETTETISLPELPITWQMFYVAENNIINGGSWNHVMDITAYKLSIPGLSAGNVVIVFGYYNDEETE